MVGESVCRIRKVREKKRTFSVSFRMQSKQTTNKQSKQTTNKQSKQTTNKHSKTTNITANNNSKQTTNKHSKQAEQTNNKQAEQTNNKQAEQTNKHNLTSLGVVHEQGRRGQGGGGAHPGWEGTGAERGGQCRGRGQEK